MDKLKNEELIAIALAINDDLQKTFSRYTDLTSNRMPEEYTSVFEPTQPAPEPVKRSPPVQKRQAPPKQSPSRQSYTPQQVLSQPIQQVPQQVIARQVPTQQIQRSSGSDSLFGLFNNAEERKIPEPSIQMIPLIQEVPQHITSAPSKDDTISKLNEIMRKMQLKEEEDRRQRDEEAKRKAAIQAQQAQFATSYAPFGMNPYMAQMNMCYPYMTNMQRPMGPNAVPYHVHSFNSLRH